MDMCCANRVSLHINYEFKQLKFECFIEVFYGFYMNMNWKYTEEFFCFSGRNINPLNLKHKAVSADIVT